MKEPKTTITFSLEELRALSLVIENGYADGDIEQDMNKDESSAFHKAWDKFRSGRARLAARHRSTQASKS